MNKGRMSIYFRGAAVVGAGLVAAREASGVPQQNVDDMHGMQNMPGMKTKGKKRYGA